MLLCFLHSSCHHLLVHLCSPLLEYKLQEGKTILSTAGAALPALVPRNAIDVPRWEDE